jgi:hypothetical protein
MVLRAARLRVKLANVWAQVSGARSSAVVSYARASRAVVSYARASRAWVLAAALVVTALGCGPVTYGLEVSKAERVIEEARAENAAYYAPYELHYAQAHLEQAHEQAARAQYEDAIRAVRVALGYGRRALTRSAQPGQFDR